MKHPNCVCISKFIPIQLFSQKALKVAIIEYSPLDYLSLACVYSGTPVFKTLFEYIGKKRGVIMLLRMICVLALILLIRHWCYL